MSVHDSVSQIEAIVNDDAFWEAANYFPMPDDWASLEGLDELEGFGLLAGHPDRFDDDCPGEDDPTVNARGDRLDLSFLGF